MVALPEIWASVTFSFYALVVNSKGMLIYCMVYIESTLGECVQRKKGNSQRHENQPNFFFKIVILLKITFWIKLMQTKENKKEGKSRKIECQGNDDLVIDQLL